MHRARRALLWTCAFLIVAAGCATRTVAPVVTAPKHPDFVFPAAAQGTDPAVAVGVERGWQFMQAGDLRSAERELTRVLKGSPQNVSAETALGYLELARGDAADALPLFDRALSRDPGYSSALAGRGYALMDLKREGEALSSFEAALKADPALVDLQGRVDVLRFRATQDLVARATSASDAGRFDDARAAYEQAIAASPDSAFLYRDLAAVERRAGRSPAAIERLRKATDLEPSDARAVAALGEIFDEQDDPVAALAQYEKAIALDPAAVPPATLERARERAALLKLPEPYRAIPSAPTITRGDLAALVGVRLQELVSRAAEQQVVITDVRGHWAQSWITPVVRASIMETLPNYQFQPNAVVRRGDLARTVSRVLSLLEALRPAVAAKWRNARLTVADVAPTHLSYPAVSMAVASGVMPLEGDAFRLLDPVTGPEAVDVISRLEALAR